MSGFSYPTSEDMITASNLTRKARKHFTCKNYKLSRYPCPFLHCSIPKFSQTKGGGWEEEETFVMNLLNNPYLVKIPSMAKRCSIVNIKKQQTEVLRLTDLKHSGLSITSLGGCQNWRQQRS
jgi:hypothetical protein